MTVCWNHEFSMISCQHTFIAIMLSWYTCLHRTFTLPQPTNQPECFRGVISTLQCHMIGRHCILLCEKALEITLLSRRSAVFLNYIIPSLCNVSRANLDVFCLRIDTDMHSWVTLKLELLRLVNQCLQAYF